MDKNINLKPNQISLVLLVANGAYASHYGFSIEDWLKVKDLVRKTQNFIELNKKLDKLPKIATWSKV